MRCLLLACVFALPVLSQEKKADEKKLPRIAIDDPAKLKNDADFKLQGEYQMDHKKFNFHVIANGNGKFTPRDRMDGLPGDGWNGKDPLFELTAIRQGQDVEIRNFSKEINEYVKIGEIKEGTLTFALFNTKGEFAKIERKSPTLGAKPPSGAVVLFDKPEDLAKWDGMKTVKLSDGEFLGVGGRTKQKFQNFTLHLEFRLPWMPNSTGQQRGNSGVYLQDRYELQVLDSFGLKGENNECGGFYQMAAPKVNMCFPPMTWQTYDIDFTAAKFENGKKVKNAVATVKHNGVIIHDKFELPRNSPGGGITKETDEPGALYLQNHSDPVVYRNIWIVEK